MSRSGGAWRCPRSLASGHALECAPLVSLPCVLARLAQIASEVSARPEAIADAGEGVCELEDLFVEPGILRGGVGTVLIEAVASRCAAAGYRQVAVTAAPRTFGFYERVGFTVGEPVETRFGPAARLRRELT